MADTTARQGFVDFIARAERFGLPVGMLRDVARSDYTYREGNSTQVSPWLDTMTFEPADLAAVANMSPSKPRKGARGVQTIYHEATHAWLDVKQNTGEVSALRQHGREYYRDAPLTTGQADDPERIFEEAIASYVGHRTSTYWQALEELTIISDILAAKPAPDAQARILGHANGSAQSDMGSPGARPLPGARQMNARLGPYRSSLVSMLVALGLTLRAHARTTACDKAKVMLETLDNSLRLYAAEHGAFPPEKHWIDALVREQSIRGPEDARDPWGHVYVFIPGEGGDYDLRSAGPDGKQGTQDDLVRANRWESATCRDLDGCGGCGS